MATKPYTWDSERRRYVDPKTGRAIRAGTLNRWVRESGDSVKRRMQKLAERHNSGELSTPEWQIAMQEEIRQSNRTMAIIAKGGFDQMSQADWGRIGAKIRVQNQYLMGFESDIIAGKLTEAEITNRAGMYADSLYATYENTIAIREREAGMTEARRVLDPAAEHCLDCPDLAAEGWVSISEIVPIGDSDCGARCRCSIEYRGETQDEQQQNTEAA